MVTSRCLFSDLLKAMMVEPDHALWRRVGVGAGQIYRGDASRMDTSVIAAARRFIMQNTETLFEENGFR